MRDSVAAERGMPNEFLDRVTRWATAEENVRSLIVVGSRARANRPADEWSDLDLVLTARRARILLDSDDWLQAIGEPWVTYVQRTPIGGAMLERRVLFAGGVAVDFVPLPTGGLRAVVMRPAIARLVARGVRTLVDKDGEVDAIPIPAGQPSVRPPDLDTFRAAVHEFLYHAVWTTRKIRRGELWTAKSGEGWMRDVLLRVLEWQKRATHGDGADTWYDGRFLESWADPPVVAQLPLIFGGYTADQAAAGLQACVQLFGQVGRETAAALKLPYPESVEARVTRLIAAEFTR